MSIGDIADHLGISRFRVGRYLKEAQEKGIVKVQFYDPNIEYEQLALKLEQALPLQRVIVAPTPYSGGIEAIRTAVGRSAAELLRDISPDDTLGITWGRTVAAMVESLPLNSLRAELVVELAGGFAQISTEVQARAVALRSAEKLKAECLQLPAPIIAENADVAQALLSESSIAKTIETAAQADIAVLGVGAANLTSMLYDSDYLSDQDFEYLRARGVVGSLMGRFFNLEGVECDEGYKNRAIALPFEQFLKIPERIVLASGNHKTQSILGMANGQLATTLVTDSETAVTLLKTITKKRDSGSYSEEAHNV